MYRVRVTGAFAAAHFLSDFHGKCENLHGHNYHVWIHAEGETLNEGGMLVDFGVIKKALKEVFKQLDHTMLNDNPFFKQNPSAERIAEFIYIEMKKILPDCPICLVEVSETDKNIASYLP